MYKTNRVRFQNCLTFFLKVYFLNCMLMCLLCLILNAYIRILCISLTDFSFSSQSCMFNHYPGPTRMSVLLGNYQVVEKVVGSFQYCMCMVAIVVPVFIVKAFVCSLMFHVILCNWAHLTDPSQTSSPPPRPPPLPPATPHTLIPTLPVLYTMVVLGRLFASSVDITCQLCVGKANMTEKLSSIFECLLCLPQSAV